MFLFKGNLFVAGIEIVTDPLASIRKIIMRTSIISLPNEAARQLNLHQGNISDCCNGKQKRVGQYMFEFDAEAAAPEVVGDEEWRDVVLDD